MIGDTLSALYNPFVWPDLAGFFWFLESNAQQMAGQKLEDIWNRQGFNRKKGDVNYRTLEAFPAVACGDSDNPKIKEVWPIAGALADEQTGYFGRIWTWVSSICAPWPGPSPTRYASPFNAWTASPVLIVGNLFDPATPYKGAQALASLLPNSSLLTVKAWGHVSFGLSACADAAVSSYMVTGAIPSVSECSADFEPFELPPFGAGGSGSSFRVRQALIESTVPASAKPGRRNGQQ